MLHGASLIPLSIAVLISAGLKGKNPFFPPHILSFLFFLSLQNNQADLENATEVLSGYLERDISQDSLQDIKQKVQDKYRFVFHNPLSVLPEHLPCQPA